MKKILISLFVASVLLFSLGVTSADIISKVSDTGVLVSGPLDHYVAIDSEEWINPDSAVLTWTHGSWPTITDAYWISSAYYTEAPVADTSWKLFEDIIEIPACAVDISGTISVTSDNAEDVYLNGVLTGSDGEVQGASSDNQEWSTILDYDLTGLITGTNTLKIIVRNYAGSSSPTSNPTGLIYKAEVTYDIDSDCDGDGVLDIDDKCLDTVTDNPSEGIGVNRHIWNGTTFETLVPAGKGKFSIVESEFSIENTYGCSCTQILEKLKAATGEEFGGHYKFGCSKGIIEAWIEGKYYIGPTHIETVEVLANLATPTLSEKILGVGKDYFLKAYGIATACSQPGCNIEFDAEHSTSDYGASWVDGVAAPYDVHGPDLLDLKVDDEFVDWGTYNSLHEYQIDKAGTGLQLSLFVNDLAGSHFNNAGSLFVEIFEDRWVQL